jgi:hypothetical protein
MFTSLSYIALHARILGELLDLVCQEGEVFEKSVHEFLQRKTPTKTDRENLNGVLNPFVKKIENLRRVLSNIRQAAGIKDDSKP